MSTGDRLQDLCAYIRALEPHVPKLHLPLGRASGAEDAYKYFETQLAPLLEFDDLKPEVFQIFREVGNLISFMQSLSDALQVHDQVEFLLVAPLLGIVPDSDLENKDSLVSRSPLFRTLRSFADPTGEFNSRKDSACFRLSFQQYLSISLYIYISISIYLYIYLIY